MRVGPYTKKSLLDFSYYAKELSCRYGFADSDILEIARHLPDECPDRFAAVKAYLDYEYVPDGNAPDEKAYRWGDFLEIAGGDARYAAMLVDRTAAGEPEAGLHPETLVDQDIRDGEAFMLAGRPIAPEDAYDLPGTVHGLYKELADNVDRFGMLFRSIQRGTCTQGLHFYYADAPKPSPGFFLPPNRPPRPVVCLDTGETFDGNPAAARPLHVSPATISQAVRYGTPVAGLISTMETNRSRLRSSSSRSSPNAVRALCRWLPRLGPPRGTRVARTVASGPDARYNRCGR